MMAMLRPIFSLVTLARDVVKSREAVPRRCAPIFDHLVGFIHDKQLIVSAILALKNQISHPRLKFCLRGNWKFGSINFFWFQKANLV